MSGHNDQPSAGDDSRKKRETRDPIVASTIGRQLKRMYDKVAEEEVPDRFAKLLAELERQERSRE